jgi:WD repeat and SOF domain-containing protein 1
MRALNAAKVERMHATPFIYQFNAHIDSVVALCRHQNIISNLLSASADGEVKLWDLQTRTAEFTAKAHDGFARGVCFVPNSKNFLSVGDDKVIKLWSPERQTENEPVNTWFHKAPLTYFFLILNSRGVHHHRNRPIYATSSSQIDVWDHSRSDPISTMTWGAETITTVKFNQVETSILASCGTDRTVCLYDIRTNTPISKSILAVFYSLEFTCRCNPMRSDGTQWRPSTLQLQMKITICIHLT